MFEGSSIASRREVFEGSGTNNFPDLSYTSGAFEVSPPLPISSPGLFFTRASYRNIKSYFSSIERSKNKLKNQNI